MDCFDTIPHKFKWKAYKEGNMDGTQKPRRMPHVRPIETPLTRPLDPALLKGDGAYASLVYFSLLLLLAAFVLLGWTFYDRTHKTQAPYYTATDTLVPLDQPNLSTRVLLNWAVEAATTAYTFDFYNYRTVFENVRNYFTATGYDNFLSALQSSNTINDVVSKKLVVSSVITDNPIILNEGATPDGTYAWQVQFPLLVTYQSASEQMKQNMVLTLLIARVSTLESPKGVGIASFVIEPFTG